MRCWEPPLPNDKQGIAVAPTMVQGLTEGIVDAIGERVCLTGDTGTTAAQLWNRMPGGYPVQSQGDLEKWLGAMKDVGLVDEWEVGGKTVYRCPLSARGGALFITEKGKFSRGRY